MPPTSSERIDIDLHLIAEQDIQRMQKVFEGFKESMDIFQTMGERLTRALSANILGDALGTGAKSNTSTNRGGLRQGPAMEGDTARTRGEYRKRLSYADALSEAYGHNNARDQINRLRDQGLTGRILAAHAERAPYENDRDLFTAPRFGTWTRQDILRMGRVGMRDLLHSSWVEDHPGMSRALTVGAGMAGAGAMAIPIMHGLRRIGGGARRVLAQPEATAYGQNLGESRNGVLGTPLFSGAMRSHVGSWWASQRASWFGLNPNYSSGDAAAAQQAIAAMGVGGATTAGGATQRENLTYAFRNITQNTGMSAEQIAPFLTNAVRYGNAPVSEMIAALNQIPAAARSAGLSVEQFTSELQASATAVGGFRGISSNLAAPGVTGVSQATGLTPETVGTMQQSTLARNITIGRTGSFWAATAGDTSGANNLQSVLWMVQQSLGMSREEAARRLHAGGPQAQAVRERVAQMFVANPQMFAGMNIEQVMRLIERPQGMIGNTRAKSTLATMGGLLMSPSGGFNDRANQRSGTNAQLDRLIRTTGSELGWHDMRKFERNYGDKSYREQYQRLNQLLEHRTGITRGEKHHLTLDLTDDARKLVYQMDTGSVADRNRGTNSGRSAIYGAGRGHAS